MTSTSHLALVGRPITAGRSEHDPSVPLVGATRPRAVRALLARSITMTALELERRLRTRRRKPSPEVRLESLLRRQRQADQLRATLRDAELRLALGPPSAR